MSSDDPYLDDSLEEVLVCPVMRCGSIMPFPEISPTLPCAKHGLLMVRISEMPIRKVIYRWFIEKIFKIKYVTHKARRRHE